MGKITFNRLGDRLGRALPEKDQYSGFLFYYDTLPGGFTANDRIKKLFSIEDAEALGIVDDYSDETKASTGGTVLITTAGAVGEVQSIFVEGGLLGAYTFVAGDAVGDVATGLAAAINARTPRTGWTATVATATVTLIPPVGLGSYNNAANISFTSVVSATGAAGTAAATVTQLTGGVSSYYAVMHYHISEFFRIQPKGVLWVGIYAQGTYDGTEIETIQNFAEGQIRNLAVYLSHETFASSQVTGSQTKLDTLQDENKPCSLLLTADFTGVTFANLSDLSSLDSERVSVVVGMDGNWLASTYSATQAYKIGEKVAFQTNVYVAKKAGTGNDPFNGTYWTNISKNLEDLSGFSVCSIGTCLGTVALAKVHENIGWVGKFPLDDGNNLSEAGIATGEVYKDLSESQKETLDDYRYIYVKKEFGLSQTNFNDSFTCTKASDDYGTIENNRTMDKAVRNIRIEQLPLVNSPVYVNPDGTLLQETIATFHNAADKPLRVMATAGELSAYAVDIDPDQNVLTTSEVTTGITLVPVGVARELVNNISYGVKIAQ